MILEELIPILDPIEIRGTTRRKIHGISYDSRKTRPGDFFLAWSTDHTPLQQIAEEASKKGASAIALEVLPILNSTTSTLIHAKDIRRKLGPVSAHFYQHPAKDLTLIGITGTNGKTTTAFLVQHLFNQLGHPCGLIGTVHYDLGQRILPASRTTPEGSDLQHMFFTMKRQGLTAAALEVSSHALHQGRTEGIPFDIAIFMNLTPDHLDYHGTMENYYQAKKILFTTLAHTSKPHPFAIINTDDTYGLRLSQELRAEHFPHPIQTFGFNVTASPSILISNHSLRSHGQSFTLSINQTQYTIEIPLIGHYNVYNATAAFAAAYFKGLPPPKIIETLRQAPHVPGRMEKAGTTPNGATAIVDYAHSPDAVEKALLTLRQLHPSRLTIVIGCGGNRDRSKRPLMAQSALQHADFAIFTADNPRYESLSDILNDMAEGADAIGKTNYLIIEDRREAISTALRQAIPGEIVLIAGKGHETTQQIGPIFTPFNDIEVARQIINQLPHP
ncbi:MAG: UDP-N-acetylmuramoyl-L-alanyl-D-glutamate--2,6-diaminopimelate ligase [Methylacidiphilales bacterium]|nr:UDP-N-acetylmuramoyl-L-alanyl-D-glutamate--2,6-diaminopimelate ligase [Candidatus Methylacidiphilales bacterium]MDW8349801.1 UDP-N-acetylmuramoyl-L-alanyl-D-glutamate--2,6-diaminopimelate ligase [Verrucomicrobiae bacterium]